MLPQEVREYLEEKRKGRLLTYSAPDENGRVTVSLSNGRMFKLIPPPNTPEVTPFERALMPSGPAPQDDLWIVVEYIRRFEQPPARGPRAETRESGLVPMLEEAAKGRQ